jgi:hypothetical protein
VFAKAASRNKPVNLSVWFPVDAEDDAEMPAEDTSDEEAAPKGRGMRTRHPNIKYAGEFWHHTNNKDQDIPVPGIELPLSTK